MTTEFYKKYRPKRFKDVIGQPRAVAMLANFLKKKSLPHSILFTGPSGCGKTTLARIVKSQMECGKLDFKEVNCADFRGIDMVREIRNHMNLMPVSGTTRIWVIDESHQLSKDAQNAFLKILEDTPKHVYFMLATTEPNKLLKTILTRCTEVKVGPVPPAEVKALIENIAVKEEIKITPEVVEAIVEAADGSARKALVILEQVSGIDDEDEQLKAVASADAKTLGIELARALINPRAKWGEIASLLKNLDEDPEGIRRLVLGYGTSCCLGNGSVAARAAMMIYFFRTNYFDSGKAGLVSSCYEFMHYKA